MSRFKYIRFRDILALFQFFIVLPWALVCKIFIRKLWIVSEEKFEARDNGYWFFKYVRENHPKQKVVYAISKKAVDYYKVKSLGKTTSFGTWAHWFWYIISDKKISSQKGAKPNAAVCYLFEVAVPIWKSKIYFLQHGVTINNAKWLYYDVCKFSMFSTSTFDEYNYINNKFGYPDNSVKLLGLCRFDNLNNSIIDKQKILVMPSWREYLARNTSGNVINDAEFMKTQYYNCWQEFINSSALIKMLNDFDKTLIFYPHRNMQIFIKCFTTSSNRIIIANSGEYDVQQLLKQSALLITDYSSVFFDFAYMKKPVLFYQFDEAEFREKQYGQGYFDYRNNFVGEHCTNLTELEKLLKKFLDNDFLLENAERLNNVFFAQDSNNCERTYRAIKES